MSSTTTTPNYGLIKPNVGSDNDLWGDHWNQNADKLDAQIKTVENKAGVVSFNGRNNVVSLTNADVVTVLPGSVTAPLMDGTATAGLATTWAKGDHVHPTDTTRAAASSVPSPSAVAPTMNSVADAGVAVAYSRGDHTHPSDTSRYAASNPSGYQTAAQVTTALLPYAPLASPALTGSPTVPTVTPSTDSSTKIASTAFVQSALGAVPGGAVIAATAPAGLNPGALWWDSTGGQLYVRYDDGNTQQFVVATNVSGGASAGDVAMAQNNVGRNKLHNGAFTVTQRGAGPFNANGYTVDRWLLYLVLDASNVSPAVFPPGSLALDESAANYLNIGIAGNAGATAATALTQIIEDVRRLSGKTVILSFTALASSAGMKLGANVQQNFGSGGSPSASVSVAGQAAVLTTGWVRYSLTFTLPSISGKTLGTAGNHGTALNLWFSSGANSASLSGNVGVQAGNIYLYGIQLEIAAPGQTQPSPLEKKDPRMELSDCQRFFCTANLQINGYNTVSNPIGMSGALPATMRAVPTLTPTGTGGVNYTNFAFAAANNNTYVLTVAASATGYLAWAGYYNASADL